MVVGALEASAIGFARSHWQNIEPQGRSGPGVFLLSEVLFHGANWPANHGASPGPVEGVVGVARADQGSAPPRRTLTNFSNPRFQEFRPMATIDPSASRRIVIFDTTLRDGEQSPGASMNLAEKLELAQALVELGVDVIEAGLPHRLARRFRGGAANRPRRPRLDHLRPGPLPRRRHRPRLGGRPRTPSGRASTSSWPPAPSIASSSCKMDKEEIIQRAVAGVQPGRRLLRATSSSRPRTPRAPRSTSSARWSRRPSPPAPPRSTSPTPSATPRRAHMGNVIRTLRNRVPNIDKAVISVHCHNDLGMAVANSLAAVEAGAGQVECTINGIGERAGNCSLEEIVMALRTRHDYLSCPHRASTPSGWSPPAGWCPTSPASRCSGTRPSSATTPSPTRRASTRTACSRNAPPTKSCGPRTSASP